MRLDRSGECWLWAGAATNFGYGTLKYQGRYWSAHRLAWVLSRGPIPDDLWVLHNCPGGDNPRCCRPDHLWLGTHADNMRDCIVKGRFPFGNIPHDGNTTLTAEKIREIRSRVEAGEPYRQLAAEYGVAKNTISNIVRRVSWKHV